jgi:hypothetical protein
MKTRAMKMAWGRGLVFGAVLLAGGALAGTARAEEEGVEKAISVAASLGSEINHSVREANGGASRGDGGMAGLTGVFSVGPVAFGATGELSSTRNGIANSTVGGLAGARLPISPRLRLLVLGEAGMRFFSDASDFLFTTTVTPSEASLPYVGGRVGITWLVLKHMDLGVMAFARTDIGEGRMVVHQDGGFLGGEPTDTPQQLGGFAGGVALQIGFRFDTTRPFYADPPPRLVRKTN